MTPSPDLAAFLNDPHSLTELHDSYFSTIDEDCPICYTKVIRPVVRTQCNHIFHHACLVEWLEYQRDDHHEGDCPSCRRVFFEARAQPTYTYTYSDMRRLFFEACLDELRDIISADPLREALAALRSIEEITAPLESESEEEGDEDTPLPLSREDQDLGTCM